MKTKTRFLSLLFVLIFLLVPLGAALAQDYFFSVVAERVDAYWESNGTLTLEYEILFHNGGNAHEIDVVDLGLPNDTYSTSNITASLNNRPASFIEPQSEYIDIGPAIYFNNPLPANSTGTFRARITDISDVLYTDSEDENYASALFSPNYFGSEFVFGASDITIVYHLPPGVQPDEPKWHTAGHPGFPEEPVTGFDTDGRITYTWRNQSASASQEYLFGASFPKAYVPAGSISEPSFFQRLGIDPEVLLPLLFCVCFALFIIGIIWLSIVADKRRRMQYLPPKIAIEGNGIKRGLTAPEAGILLEQPMDKILTMILFSTIKKGAAQVASQDPLEVAMTAPPPKDLHEYEASFLEAFQQGQKGARRRALQDMMVTLVKGVANKMKGFSKRETVEYYKKITDDAWKQVESAGTPKVMSKAYDENLEWTMLDPNYGDRTQEVFTGRPVYAPRWWPYYVGGSQGGRSVISAPTRSTGGGVSLPTLPGADFAASMVRGTQNFAGGVVGNLADFTGGVTKVTNPPPPPSASRGGGFSGGGSSCACACAGCACACAGGGR
ncbi:MAG: hypothetical protein WEC16_01775 [Anaerolineales bacterium]